MISVSQIKAGMTASSSPYDTGGRDVLKYDENLCGCVFQFSLDSSYSIYSMSALICGSEIEENSNGDTCDLNAIAEPDNLAYSHSSDSLLICEDTSAHTNNALWQYRMGTGELSRILSAPLGAEMASPAWLECGECSYVEAVVSHPFAGIEDYAPGEEASYLGVLRVTYSSSSSCSEEKDLSRQKESTYIAVVSSLAVLLAVAMIAITILVGRGGAGEGRYQCCKDMPEPSMKLTHENQL